jgi:two-component system phosphate regulon sensor histidine kinase PhoR
MEISDDLPPVLVDGGRVHQVVTNLVHNAIKFTNPNGRITVRAEVEKHEAGTQKNGADENESWVKISVGDTGIGIPPENLPRIFERFYKTDRSRAVGGTGLGLAIAKHIVRAHGGEIWAESVEGEGSVFYFTLPVAEGDRADGAAVGFGGAVNGAHGAAEQAAIVPA